MLIKIEVMGKDKESGEARPGFQRAVGQMFLYDDSLSLTLLKIT